MSARVVDGQPVPDVSRREMTSLHVIVDDAMERFSFLLVGFVDESTRAHLRTLIEAAVWRTAHECRWAYQRATESAIKQTEHLMSDPAYYEKQSKRNAAQRKRLHEDMDRQHAEHKQHRMEREENIRALADSGKLVTMPNLQIKPRTKPTEVLDPETE